MQSSFFLLNRDVKALRFCFLFTKPIKVVHSSEVGARESDEEKDDGTFESGLRGRGDFFFLFQTSD